MVGNLLHTIVGHIRDPCAALSGAIDGDIVETYAQASDDAQIAGRLDGSGGNRCPTGNDGGRVGSGDQGLYLFGAGCRCRSSDQFDTRLVEDCLLDVQIGPGVVGQHDSVAAGFLVRCHFGCTRWVDI
ncbi:hypothetical protein D3C75_613890 [compost metagenome]